MRYADPELELLLRSANQAMGAKDSMHSIACSNLAVVELLTRLLEKDYVYKPQPSQHPCKCETAPPRQPIPLFAPSFIGDGLFPDEALTQKIVETLDLAEQLLKTDKNDTVILNGYDRHSNLVRFGNLSQQIRNELANRKKLREKTL